MVVWPVTKLNEELQTVLNLGFKVNHIIHTHNTAKYKITCTSTDDETNPVNLLSMCQVCKLITQKEILFFSEKSIYLQQHH